MSLTPINLEIIWIRLIAIIDEMSGLLQRSSFSVIVREAHDFVVVLLDREGNTLAQSSATIPPFTLAASYAVKACLKKIPIDDIGPEDVIISNDPWISTGHTFDVLIFKPILRRNEIIGFAATIAHWSDVGGRGWTLAARDHFEEGLVIPVVKLIEGGRENKVVYDFIRENVRNVEFALGDSNAQIAAADGVAKKVVELLDEMPDVEFSEIASAILARSESAMKRGIRELQNGTYRHHLRVDGIDGPLDIHVALIVRDESIVVDYDGTSAQSKYAINSVLNYSAGYTLFALKCVLCPDTPNNVGNTFPIEVKAPLGCMLNPRPPASLVSRHVVGFFCAEATLGALAKVRPDAVPAGSSTSWVLNFEVLPSADHRPTTFQFMINGGLGALGFKDGRSCSLYPSSVRNAPIEVLEKDFPVRFEFKELRGGSGGSGTYRGGLGQILQMRALAPMMFTGISTCTQNPAPGADGGASGALGRMFLNDRPLAPRTPTAWNAGELVTVLLPGGGGFGDPAMRSAENDQFDSLNELLGVAEIERKLIGGDEAKA